MSPAKAEIPCHVAIQGQSIESVTLTFIVVKFYRNIGAWKKPFTVDGKFKGKSLTSELSFGLSIDCSSITLKTLVFRNSTIALGK